MRRRAFVAFALLAAASAPAAAQIVGPRPPSDYQAPNPFIGDSRLPGPGVQRDVRDIRQRIDRAGDSGAISRREAKQLDREARLIRRLERRYASDGLSASERSELEARALYLRSALNRPRPAAADRKGRR
jgi:hypothetical protein